MATLYREPTEEFFPAVFSASVRPITSARDIEPIVPRLALALVQPLPGGTISGDGGRKRVCWPVRADRNWLPELDSNQRPFD